MKKNDRKKRSTKEVATETSARLVSPLAALIRNELHEFVVAQGMRAMAELLEHEREEICGPAYARDRDGPRRAGSAPGELILGGRRVRVKRPRVRDDHGEVHLPSWLEFADEDPLHARALEQMVIGVATRKYKRSLEEISHDVETRGTSKSAVSRRFKAATQKQLDGLLNADLSELAITAIMIDGIYVDEHVILIALGIDEGGRKHVLGLWEGATENHRVVVSLLSDLVKRGLDPNRSLLFVVDGSGGMRKGIRKVFGKRAIVQRCQVHKRRNVLDHLPKELHVSVGKGIRDAYKSKSADAAKKRLEALAKQLESEHPGASRSLKEGLAETLTVKGMKLPGYLERALSTTNMIENVNGGIRDITRRVKRWRGGQMILRWIAAALIERRKTFRRLRGYKGMPVLTACLRANDAKLEAEVAREAEVA